MNIHLLQLWDVPIERLKRYKVYAKLHTHLVSCTVEEVIRNDYSLAFRTKPVHLCRDDKITEIQVRDPSGKKIHALAFFYKWDDVITHLTFTVNII
jgi:hypothetical protein